MDVGYAIAKGVIQGLTEFLPVSSTAHLVLMDTASRMLGFSFHAQSHQEEEFFNILVQVGTLGAVLYYFRQDLAQMMLRLFKRSAREDAGANGGGAFSALAIEQLPGRLLVSIAVTAVVTLSALKLSEPMMSALGMNARGIYDISEFYFRNPAWVGVHLVAVGLLMLVSQRVYDARRRRLDDVSMPVDEAAPSAVRDETEPSAVRDGTGPSAVRDEAGPTRSLSWFQAVMIGLFQAFAAVFHGMSRSGTTISAGLLAGVDRLSATRYSFLLSVPTFVLATLYEAYKFYKTGHIAGFAWGPMIVGTVVAGVVGYFCVKLFVGFVARHRLDGFALYCILVGGSVAWYLW